jgi:23S rRNA (cytosine1962-C5)-methyltransferase
MPEHSPGETSSLEYAAPAKRVIDLHQIPFILCGKFPMETNMSMISDDPANRPTVRLAAGRSKRARGGYPWIFSNEIEMTPEIKALPSGSLVTIEDAGGEKLGVAIFNPHSLIAARFLDRDSSKKIDAEFFAACIERALRLRSTLFEVPFYRLIHAEADGLPGLIIDRYSS